MGAGMMPKGGGGGGVLGWDPYGNQGPNPKPSFSDYSTAGGANTMHPSHGGRPGGPPTQTEAQRQAFNTANEKWARIDAARKKRREAYLAMAQKTGDVPREYRSRAGKKEAGDPLSPVQASVGMASSYEPALYGQPRKWRDQYASIVNLRT